MKYKIKAEQLYKLIEKQKEYIEYLRTHFWDSERVSKFESEIAALESGSKEHPEK